MTKEVVATLNDRQMAILKPMVERLIAVELELKGQQMAIDTLVLSYIPEKHKKAILDLKPDPWTITVETKHRRPRATASGNGRPKAPRRAKARK